jgi:pimeloyl-ACP methyl ester carboxylesterase
MGCGASLPPVPELGPPKIDLAPPRVTKLHRGSGKELDIAYRVFREDLKDAKQGVVVWQHAYGDTGENIWQKGKVDMLDDYCVIVPDALAHGKVSSKPTDPECYQPKVLADGIAAILDQEKITRKAHYVGYSMGGYIGCCLLANCPERWSTMAIGGWNPEGVLPGFVAGILARTYTQPWMDMERDTPALKQACYACCNPVPNLEEALAKSGRSAEGYPRVLLWAGESDMVVGAIRACSTKFGFPLVTAPGSHEHVNVYAAGIQQVRDRLSEFLKPVK